MYFLDVGLYIRPAPYSHELELQVLREKRQSDRVPHIVRRVSPHRHAMPQPQPCRPPGSEAQGCAKIGGGPLACTQPLSFELGSG